MKGQGLDFGKWAKAGDYRLVDGYIVPVQESGQIFYNLNDLQREKGSRKPTPDYIVSAIIGLDVNNDKEVLSFVKRFGLLGLLPHKYLEPQVAVIGGQEYSLVPSRSDMGELFNPEEIARQYKIDLNDFLENGFYYAKYKMSEPLDEFKEAITEYQQIGKWLNAIEIAKKGKTAPLRALLLKEEHYQEVAKHGEVGELLQTAGFDLSFQLVEAQGSIKRSVVLGGDGKLKTLWGFDSLLDAAYFYLIQDLSFNYWVGECARCGKLFLSSAGKQEYCSRTCQDTTRKAASRKAKKGAK